ncbi:MAG: pip [Proteobacteria bacterium]|nr:pip [Pseudomonadota bacterium]
MKELYPHLEPYAVRTLDVDGGHRLYVEECGSPHGLPVVYLHGGPGSGCKAFHRRFFDPSRYRIVLLDQRGSGRSLPAGGLENNTTHHLVQDLEQIRERLDISRWVVFGGSWGSTLGLLYAQTYPERVSGMVLRGSFLARQRDVDWFLGDGVRRIYPERWAEFMSVMPASEPDDLIATLHGLLLGSDELAQRRAAKAWTLWSEQIAQGEPFDAAEFDKHPPAAMLQKARIELHYAVNRYFLEENRILRHCDRLPAAPIVLIHGRRDLVCPLESAYLLHQALPAAELRVLPRSGHLPVGEEMIDALVSATDEMADRLES